MITVLLQGVPRWACWKRKVSKHSELIRSCKLNDNKVQENHSSYQECSCPFRMLWKRIGVLRECCQMYERWRAHTNSLKSAIRACRQHCNLKKCPWEPDIFLKPVSSVFEMTWLGLPRRLLNTWPETCGVISTLALQMMAEQQWLPQILLFMALIFFLISLCKMRHTEHTHWVSFVTLSHHPSQC